MQTRGHVARAFHLPQGRCMPRGSWASGAHYTEIFSKSNVEIFGKLDLKNICRNPHRV